MGLKSPLHQTFCHLLQSKNGVKSSSNQKSSFPNLLYKGINYYTVPLPEALANYINTQTYFARFFALKSTRDGICSNNPHVSSQSPRLLVQSSSVDPSAGLSLVSVADSLALPCLNAIK